MSSDCIFCRIAQGEIPAETVYQDDEITAFRDIEPQARTHILVIPNQHFDSLDDAYERDAALLGRLVQVCARVAREDGIEQSGYRVLTNVGPDGGQTVEHMHFHVLGGNKLTPGLG